MSAKADRGSLEMPWWFVSRSWGGYQTPSPVGYGWVRVVVRIYHPDTVVADRVAAARYYGWVTSGRLIAVLAIMLAWSGLNSIADWRLALAIAVAGVSVLFFAGAGILRARARFALEHTNTLRISVLPGRSHWFKPDASPLFAPPETARAVDLLELVDVLRQAGLVDEHQWRDLWQKFWTHAGRQPQVQAALGWEAVTSAADEVLNQARAQR